MKNLLRFLVGTVLFVLIFGAATNVLRDKSEAAVTYTYRYEKDDSLDVIFVGASTCHTYLSCQEFWNDYGIAAYNLGSSLQSMQQAYYALKYALANQSPKLAVVEIGTSICVPVQESNPRVHWLADNLERDAAWYDLAWNTSADGDELEVIFPIIAYHTRWKDVAESDFAEIKDDNKGSFFLLNTTSFEDFTVIVQDYKEDIPDETYSYLYKIKELCEENDVELLFVCSPIYNLSAYCDGAYIQGMVHTLEANEDFQGMVLNLCDYYDEIGLDPSMDYYDKSHVNIAGTMKVSSFVGTYIDEHYDLPDRRTDSDYQEWEKSYSRYTKDWVEGISSVAPDEYKEYYIETFMENKENVSKEYTLSGVTDFNEYLTKINDDDFTVFIAIMDEGTNALDETSLGLLRELGLTSDFTDAWCYSYYAVISQDSVIECLSPDSLECIGTIDDGTPYTIYSEGTDTGSCSIKIDDTEYAVNSRGMNFVVMRNDTGEVIDSVCFDTYSDLAVKR